MAEDILVGDANDIQNMKRRNQSFFSRVWNGLFRSDGDDFERRLQYISKEEATLLNRMNRRSSNWRATAKNLIVVSVILEVVAVAYAIVTTRLVILDWKMRALRVLPIFLLPALSSALYWSLLCFTKMRDHRDQKTLERLRAERQAKIDELKERTNYYTTQQLIQRYDPDPAAKAAAASVLASKLGADSGLKVFLGDEFQYDTEATGKSNDFEPVKSTGLRRRNPPDVRSRGSSIVPRYDQETIQPARDDVSEVSQVVVEHQNPTATSAAQDGGWIARVAALLVGEDPTQSYALICGNCHMHNGLAMKEDFPFVTYYCPHCRALNRPRNSGDTTPATSTLDMRPSTMAGADFSGFTTTPMVMSRRVSAANTPPGERETIHKLPPKGPTPR